MNLTPVVVDYDRDRLLSPESLELLTEYYLHEGETSPQDAFARAAYAYCGGDVALAQRIYDAVSQLHFMFASPILSNAPAPGKKPKGLPISCFLSYVPDTVEGLVEHQKELAWLSIMGGGVGGHWGDVRPVSKKAPGPLPFLKVVDSGMLAWKQGTTRKGSYAGYLDVSHPDIVEFLGIRVPTGDQNRKMLNMHHAINISDAFMHAVLHDLEWNLIDPSNKEVRETIKARELWQRILETRIRTGEPYLNFIDAANEALNPFQKRLGLKTHGSNLCNEIHLATDEERTAVCCLSSMNLETFDSWPKTLVADLVTFLDNVLEEFIRQAPPELHKAVRSAMAERSIGIGAMGFHSYLQKHGVPFESNEAGWLNDYVFSFISTEAKKQSAVLALERGEPSDLVGSGMRNAHLLAIAPNANSSIIVGCSPSIEPLHSNYFVRRSRIGTHVVKNRYLQELLAEKGMDTTEVWESILNNDGSVQHLEGLNGAEKACFKTFGELDQHWVIRHAADRQPHICQGQSVNLFFPAKSPKSYVNSVHLMAWKERLKGLYYARTTTGAAAEKVATKVERIAIGDAAAQTEECTACHG